MATVTASGRILAVSRWGNLMYSDNGGGTWNYGRIEINGNPVEDFIADLYQIPGGGLIASAIRLEEASVGYFSHYIRTDLLRSSDNGNTWTRQAFPHFTARHPDTGVLYYGVDIYGFYEGPGGELLAYGSTSGTNHPGFVLWSIGGVIFRQTGSTWEQVHFGYGPVAKITGAGGRAVAISHNAILDSADGAGWNGYVIGGANIDLNNGNTLDSETRFRLRIIDIEVVNGTYLGQGATFVPYGDSGLIDTHIFDRTFRMTSPSPFSGFRNWNAFSEPYRGGFARIGNNVVASNFGAVYHAGSPSGGFSLANDQMIVDPRAIAAAGGNTAYAIESSKRVWRTTSGGSSWEMILDLQDSVSLQLMGAVDGILYARGDGNLWTSYDYGDSWQESSTDFRGFRTILDGGNGKLLTPAGGNRIQVSEDKGRTWTTKTIQGSSSITALMLLKTQSGRLIVPSEGKDVRNEGVFYVSDDDGETWDTRIAGLQWNENPKAIAQTPTGRILVATNSFASFDPLLYISDDNGDTWSVNDSLLTLDGLDPISNQPWLRVLDFQELRVSSTGRVLVLGDDEILTSDDDGASWTPRVNLNRDTPGPWLNHELRDLVQAGSRWIAVGSYRTPYPQSRNKFYLLISDDDGATWGQRPFPTEQTNTFPAYLLAEPATGRVILAGNNGAVFVSEPDPEPATGGGANPKLFVREGRTESVPVGRPVGDGTIEASYVLRQDTAEVDVDFKPGGGVLSWAGDDFEDKAVIIETIDNAVIDATRELSVQVVFETEDDFVGTMEIPVAIRDNDVPGPAGLVFEDTRNLYTSEDGDSIGLEFALESRPSQEVTVQVAGLDPTEGSLSATEFIFTPQNWNQLQVLTVTGIDDNFPDGDATYDLAFVMESNDTQYASLSPTALSITNLGDEDYVVGGELFDDFLKQVPVEPFLLNGDFAFSFKVPVSGYAFVFGSMISPDMENWSPGPAPVEGPTENGLTTYTLVLPSSDTPQFARITFDLQQ